MRNEVLVRLAFPGMGTHVVTVDELEQMSPGDRERVFERSIVWDLEKAPPELVDRARRRLLERIGESATPTPL
jgi:hypothetical protein